MDFMMLDDVLNEWSVEQEISALQFIFGFDYFLTQLTHIVIQMKNQV